MAVPLVGKGVVVVAVGYDIAPKGTDFQFWQGCLSRLWKIRHFVCIWNGNDVLLLVSVSGNMDLMVSQVRRSVVSVVQQYSHIRYLCLLSVMLITENINLKSIICNFFNYKGLDLLYIFVFISIPVWFKMFPKMLNLKKYTISITVTVRFIWFPPIVFYFFCACVRIEAVISVLFIQF